MPEYIPEFLMMTGAPSKAAQMLHDEMMKTFQTMRASHPAPQPAPFQMTPEMALHLGIGHSGGNMGS